MYNTTVITKVYSVSDLENPQSEAVYCGSNEALAKELGCSKSTASRLRKELDRHHIVTHKLKVVQLLTIKHIDIERMLKYRANPIDCFHMETPPTRTVTADTKPFVSHHGCVANNSFIPLTTENLDD